MPLGRSCFWDRHEEYAEAPHNRHSCLTCSTAASASAEFASEIYGDLESHFVIGFMQTHREPRPPPASNGR